MAYSYTITECDEYIRLEVQGTRVNTDVTAASLKMWKAAADSCHRTGHDLILAVFHLSGVRSVADTFNIVEGVHEWLWPELAIAYVDMDPVNVRENTIAEQSAMMHGINFRTFRNEAAAINWLHALHSSKHPVT